METLEQEIPQAALSALKSGNKVEAVKITRQELNITLAEALSRIDTYLANDHEIEAIYRQNRGRINPYVSIIFLVGVILVVVGLAGKLLTSTN